MLLTDLSVCDPEWATLLLVGATVTAGVFGKRRLDRATKKKSSPKHSQTTDEVFAGWSEDDAVDLTATRPDGSTSTGIAARGATTSAWEEATGLEPVVDPSHVAERGDDLPSSRHEERERPRRSSLAGWAWLTACLMLATGLLWQSNLWHRNSSDTLASTQPTTAADAASPRYRYRKIEDIQPGQLVLAANTETGQIERRRVVQTFSRVSDHLRVLTFVNSEGREQTVETTDEHPFWVVDRTAPTRLHTAPAPVDARLHIPQGTWRDAHTLQPGDTVTTPTGSPLTLTHTTRREFPHGTPVYNFEVEELHSYIVGAEADNLMLVHNADYAPGSGVDLTLKYKPGWTDAQRAAARHKVTALTEADTVVIKSPNRSGTSASSRYRQAGKSVSSGHDVDHVIDLQFGGADDILNMTPLDASVNRSLGSQIQHRIKDLPAGTRINRVMITD